MILDWQLQLDKLLGGDDVSDELFCNVRDLLLDTYRVAYYEGHMEGYDEGVNDTVLELEKTRKDLAEANKSLDELTADLDKEEHRSYAAEATLNSAKNEGPVNNGEKAK